jgi:hypothetical protein
MAIYVKQRGIDKKLYGFDSFEGFAPSVVEEYLIPGISGQTRP